MLEEVANKQIDLHTQDRKKNKNTINKLSHTYTNMYKNNSTQDPSHIPSPPLTDSSQNKL